MKPNLKTTAKTIFLLMLLVFYKTERLIISVIVLFLNIWLYPNFIIDVTILRRWMTSRFLRRMEDLISLID